MDITKYLIKLTPREDLLTKKSDLLNSSKYFASGDSYYRIPREGTTTFWSSNEEPLYQFRYNWKTKEIEAFKRIGLGYQFIESSPLSVFDFLYEESPEYWYKIYLQDLLKD